uniref:Protein argonaute N-terminal domain-containing protein n=1 Tax=Tetranychus urticae TaxID=32264 RepID=T1L5H1_TETUR
MSKRPYKPRRGRGRGHNVNSVARIYDGNSENRVGPELLTPLGNFDCSGQDGDNKRSRDKVDEEFQIGLADPEFVKRRGYLSENFGRKIKLMTNHFSFQYSPDVQIYHYDFSWLCYGKDGEEPKEQKLNSDNCYKLFDAVMAKYPEHFTSTSSVGYDGAANVYLPYELESESSNLAVPDVELEDGVKKNFIVTFKGGKVISLASVKEYYAGSKMDDTKRKSLQEVIHIILKFPSRYNMKALGRLAMFPINAERYYLSNWMELALGHRKSLRFSEIGLTLVVDRASAAFLKSGNGLDFVKSIIDRQGGSLSTFKPSPAQIEALRRAFAGVKISTVHLGYTKKYVVKDIVKLIRLLWPIFIK